MTTAFQKGRICFLFILLLIATSVIAAPPKRVDSQLKLGFLRHSQVQKALQNTQIQKQGVLKKSVQKQNYTEKLDSLIELHFDDQNSNTISRKIKTTYLYDSYGNIISEIFIEYDNLGNLADTEKYEHSYDLNGNLISIFFYDNDNGELELNQKYEYSYDSNNTLIYATLSEWRNNQWAEYGKTEYSYDSDGNLISEIKYDVEYDGPMQEFAKREYSYDSNGNLISAILYYWNNEWEKRQKMEIEFDLSISIENIACGNVFVFLSSDKTQIVNKPIYMKNDLGYDLTAYYSPFKGVTHIINSVASRAKASVAMNKIQGNMFEINNHLNEPVELTVHALDGRKIATSFIHPSTNIIDMTEYSVGVYLISCRINGKLIQSFRIAR